VGLVTFEDQHPPRPWEIMPSAVCGSRRDSPSSRAVLAGALTAVFHRRPQASAASTRTYQPPGFETVTRPVGLLTPARWPGPHPLARHTGLARASPARRTPRRIRAGHPYGERQAEQPYTLCPPRRGQLRLRAGDRHRVNAHLDAIGTVLASVDHVVHHRAGLTA